MKTRMSCSGVLFALLFMVGVIAVQAQSVNPQEILKQYISDLHNNPNDTALREKIIALAQTMRPAPAIPEEARGHYVMAATFVEKAKDSTGFERAVGEYKAALLAAPWWADAYKKLAIAQKAAERYDDAIASLNLYLLTQPADARDAQDEIYKLKALKQSAADDQAKRQKEEQQRAWESSPAAIAARKQSTFDTFLAGLDGRRYVYMYAAPAGVTIDIRGRFFVFGLVNYMDLDGFHPGYRQGGFPGPNPAAIRGMETVVQMESSTTSFHPVTATFIISADGSSITRRTLLSNGTTSDDVFLWQR
jgi:hypothetical protein